MRVPMFEFASDAFNELLDARAERLSRQVMRDIAKMRTTKNPLARANILRLDRALLREIKRGR